MDLQLIRYLVGFSGSDGALLLSGSHAILLVDGRYTTQAQQEATVHRVIEYREKMEGIATTSIQEDFRQINFDPATITLAQYLILKDRLPDTLLTPVKDRFGLIRIRKDQAEVATIRRAAKIASSAFNNVLKQIRAGMKERDLALQLDNLIRTEGAEAAAFATIVASGPNAALPHARPGERRLTSGDFIIIDYGARYSGYCSDETCTVALGPLSEDQNRVYAVVREAHDRGLEMIRPGICCKEIDRIVRSYIHERGFGEYFGHATGHGVGLEVHEAPRLAQTSETILEPGMVVTVEPGIYLPGQWGVRIEDLAVVTETGCDILTGVSKTLTIVEG